MASKVKGKSKKATSTGGATRRGRTRTSRLSSQHQVTIPVDVLREAGFVVGDELVFEVREGVVVLSAPESPESNQRHMLCGAAGDAFKGFDWDKERLSSWPE